MWALMIVLILLCGLVWCIDDLRPTFRFYDDNVAVTPNIDQLASQSTIFLNAYAQQALCGPSRTSFLTSRRPDSTRLYDVHSYWRESAGNFTTLPQFFKENGYHTASIGKVFHPGKVSNFTDDYPYSWSEYPYHPSTFRYKMAKVCPGFDGDMHMNLVCPVDVSTQPEQTLPDIQSAEYAIKFLQTYSRDQNKSKPFFLAIGFHKPHIPLKYPYEYLDLYRYDSIGLAPDPLRPLKMPLVAWNPFTDLREREDVQKLNIKFPFGPIPEYFQRYIRQSYYAAVSYMDDLVGKVLGTLEELGLSRNTIVLFFGDHGWSLGEHQEWSKYSNFEVSLRVPLLIRVPGLTNSHVESPTLHYIPTLNCIHGDHYYNRFCPRKPLTSLPLDSETNDEFKKRTDALVELVDVFPTLLELTGFPPLRRCPEISSHVQLCTEGTSLSRLLYKMTKSMPKNSKSFQWKTAAFSQYPRPAAEPQEDSDQPSLHNITIMGYTIRTPKYRYTEWIDFDANNFSCNWSSIYGRELYDWKIDPLEDNNVVDERRYRKVVRYLAKRLRGGWRYA